MDQLDDDDNTALGLDIQGYGYQWYVPKVGVSGDLEGAAVAERGNGQLITFLPKSNTTIAIMNEGTAGLDSKVVFSRTILNNRTTT